MTEVFEQVCPTYMAYGMSWEQFWYGDPWMAKDFADAYLLKKKAKNEELWLQGLYIHRAVYAVVASAFGNRSEKYVSNPFDFLPKTRAEKEYEEEQKRQKVINYFNALRIKGNNNKAARESMSNGEPGNVVHSD